MRLKKRVKSSRFRASQTARRGRKARTRGSGNQGGKGWAGTGKRGDQKKTLIIKLFGNDYFGKDRALRAGKPRKKLKSINLSSINDKTPNKEGIIDLTGYKVLGEGEINAKLKIRASAFSKSAEEKIRKAGGASIGLASKDDKDTKK